ncbi:hypothetical protein [Synechococcus sp. A15-60]|uniref:hypothetical protein n=1 Tax=Synechococcus sp. A15-60 TaxID=1050655 RepID=UPI001647819C|nr:hypothetical protein [Synechococcus sp. A15-60]QNI47016.1 hypothetical protein SynA1560_00324 [Synechococcus sp. A15-60]
MSVASRPALDPERFETALLKAELSEDEAEIIDHIRYIGVFNELSLRQSLSLASKPPALYKLCKACTKIGAHIANDFSEMMSWSQTQSDDQIAWHGNLICSIAYTCDGRKLQPEDGTSLYHTFAVHRELFNGLESS